MIHQVTTSGTTSDNEWQRVTTIMTTNGTTSDNDSFPFFRIREEPTTKHPKENSLILEEDLQEGLLN